MKKAIMTMALLFTLTAMLSSCSITMPVNATSNPVGAKVGSAKAMVILGFLYFDQDASIRTAARNGGITRISTVDMKYFNVLNLFSTYETIVTGE
jgi:hypothetical protein